MRHRMARDAGLCGGKARSFPDLGEGNYLVGGRLAWVDLGTRCAGDRGFVQCDRVLLGEDLLGGRIGECQDSLAIGEACLLQGDQRDLAVGERGEWHRGGHRAGEESVATRRDDEGRRRGERESGNDEKHR